MRHPISIDLPDVHLCGNQPWDVAAWAALRGDVSALSRARESAVEVQAELRGLIRAIDRALDDSRAGSARSAA